MVLCTEKELRLSVLNTHTHTHTHKEENKLWNVFDVPIILIVVMVPQVFAHVQTHRVALIKMCIICA